MHILEIQYSYRKRQQNEQIDFSAAAQEAAALFVSTAFYLCPHHSLKCFIKRTPGERQVCAFLLFKYRARLFDNLLAGGMPQCRSPPL